MATLATRATALMDALDALDPDTFEDHEAYRQAALEIIFGTKGIGGRTAEVTISAARAAAQSTGGNFHVEFDAIDGALYDDGLVELSLGTGQAQGLVTLKAGLAYRIEAFLYADVVNSGSRSAWIEDDSVNNGNIGGEFGRNLHFVKAIVTQDSDLGDLRRTRTSSSECETPTLTEDKVIKLEFVSGYLAVFEGTRMIITEVPD